MKKLARGSARLPQAAIKRRAAPARWRALFLTVLHRLMGGGSDLAAERWRTHYHIAGVEGIQLHQVYRSMAWLGGALAAEEQDGRTPFAPRCTKDVVEEQLFAARRDLLSSLDLVFMDTTSLYFEGAGGRTLGRHGYSKDHRPDLKQMILAVVIDGEGRPVCSEMWPGDTADVTSLIPVVDRLRRRFAVGRVCVVADRGMISAETIAALEARDLLYILGTRERNDGLVREVVLADPVPFVPLIIPGKTRRKETDYGAKAVKLSDRRYIVCINHHEAAKDAADRAALVAALERQLKRGDKALVGKSGIASLPPARAARGPRSSAISTRSPRPPSTRTPNASSSARRRARPPAWHCAPPASPCRPPCARSPPTEPAQTVVPRRRRG
jgi:hypothetical protein